MSGKAMAAMRPPFRAFRELRLVKWRDITPRIRRLTFSGADLAVYDSGSMHVSLLFPPEGLAKPEWPRPGR